jgi:hypothetical protein
MLKQHTSENANVETSWSVPLWPELTAPKADGNVLRGVKVSHELPEEIYYT